VPSVASFVQVLGSTPGPTFTQVGSGPSTLQASNSSVAVAYPRAQGAGNLNIVAVGWGDTTSSISSVTDSRGNSYTLAVGPTSNTGLQQSIYYAKNIAGGSNTVTVKFNQAASYPDVRILEYGGLDTSNPLDAKAAAAGSGTTANSGPAVTTSANELIFGAGTTGTAFSAAGSGFVNRMINVYGNIAEDKTVTSSGSYNATATTSSAAWVMQMATFRGSGQGSLPPPTVSAISPRSGTTAGGTSATITGTAFQSGASVTFGGAAATNITVVSSTSITATTAAHAAGAVNVVVTNTDGQSATLANGYTYVSPNPPPTVSSVTPNSGPVGGGTAVTIAGTNFVSGATVTLGGTAATNVVVVSATQITATAPAHAAGAVTVTVTNPDTQSGSLSSGFTYVAAPTVSSVTPNSGPVGGGTAVTIAGTNFVSGATVTFGGTAATGVVVVSATQITATTPAHAAGAVTVTVTNPDTQSGSLANGFTYATLISISFAQVAAATPQTATQVVTATYPFPQSAGNLNIVVVGWHDATATVQSVRDSAGNVYTLAIGPTSGNKVRQSIYYAANIVGGNNTVTVTFNQNSTSPDIRILEYTGVSALDVKAGASGTGAKANSGSVTTTSSNELIFGAGTTTGGFTGAGSGFTSRIITTPDADIAEDKVVTNSGSYNATATGSAAWVMQMVAFK